MPGRLCVEPRCPEPAVYRGRCRPHARDREKRTHRAGYKIYRLKRWRMTRDRFLRENPLCAVEGCGRIATDVHHRVDIDAGGDPWAFSNLEQLCHSHHSQETRRRQIA